MTTETNDTTAPQQLLENEQNHQEEARRRRFYALTSDLTPVERRDLMAQALNKISELELGPQWYLRLSETDWRELFRTADAYLADRSCLNGKGTRENAKDTYNKLLSTYPEGHAHQYAQHQLFREQVVAAYERLKRANAGLKSKETLVRVVLDVVCGGNWRRAYKARFRCIPGWMLTDATSRLTWLVSGDVSDVLGWWHAALATSDDYRGYATNAVHEDVDDTEVEIPVELDWALLEKHANALSHKVIAARVEYTVKPPRVETAGPPSVSVYLVLDGNVVFSSGAVADLDVAQVALCERMRTAFVKSLDPNTITQLKTLKALGLDFSIL